LGIVLNPDIYYIVNDGDTSFIITNNDEVIITNDGFGIEYDEYCPCGGITPTPPVPTPTPTPTPVPFTPADLNNLHDWWRTDSKLDLSGTSLLSWSGIVNDSVFLPVNNTAEYVATDADWNNEPSIILNNAASGGGDYGYYTPIGIPAFDDRTVILVAKLLNANVTDYSPIVIYNQYNSNNSPRFGIFGMRSTNQYNFYSEQYSPQENITGSAIFESANYCVLKMSYTSSSGVYDFSVSQTSVFSGGTSFTKTGTAGSAHDDDLILGDYPASGYNTAPKMSVVEVISIFGIPTNSEILNIQTYLNNRYGI
jgi:hypothetical protein